MGASADGIANDCTGILGRAVAAGRASLTEPEAKQLLASFGIRVPAGCSIDAHGAPDLSGVSLLRPPLVAKVISADVLHKSESGGVMLRLDDLPAVAAAVDTIAARHRGVPIEAFLVEEMAPAGVELVIGGNVDASFGPAILVGIGGIFIEVLNDVSMRLCPITRDDARDMLASLRGAALLGGARGHLAVNVEAVIDAMLAIGGADGLLIRHQAMVSSLDVNPLIASGEGCVAVDARIMLRTSETHHPAIPASPKQANNLSRLLSPRSIVVVGASSDGSGLGNAYIRNLKSFGFSGSLSIIHPTARSIDGVPCYASLGALPEAVDYAYVAIPAARVPATLAAAAGRLAFAQVISSGFAEVAGGESLQTELLEGARRGGVRVVGPNCLGLHSTRARVTFIDKVVDTVGTFGVITQSGGLAVDLLRRGQARGVRFSHLVTIGNSADVSVVEILDELIGDQDTKVIGLYLESVADGRALFDSLCARFAIGRSPKPVVLLKGGTSSQGQRAAQSHTGALASDERIWSALAQQTGVVRVDTLDAFIDAALTFQLIQPNYARPTHRVCLFGNGGGTSVIACDTLARHGLAVLPFAPAIIKQLEALNLPPGASVLNPIDTPAGVLSKNEGALVEAILNIAHRAGDVDAIVVHLNLPVIVGYYDETLLRNLIEAAIRSRDAATRKVHFMLVLRSDGSAAIDDIRRKYRGEAVARGIPVYDEMPQAAQALAALAWVERHGGPQARLT
jgi:acyl-CoA synthetase (NDP forming)